MGRIPLYLLDADIEDNPDDVRQVTDRLYGGDTEHRLRQEILLGVGGVRALDALGIDAQVFHTNEGHAGFLGLERMRRCIVDDGLSFPEAVEAVRAGCIFTTHTPVPAGIDRFPRELMRALLRRLGRAVRRHLDELMALGHRPDDEPTRPASTWRSWACASPAGRTPWPSSTARSAGRCSPTCGPACRADEVPIAVGHQRRARPARGSRRR